MFLSWFMSDPHRRATSALLGPLFVGLGLVVAVVLLVHLSRVPRTLPQRAVATSTASRCGPIVGDSYEIRVGADRYWCSAGLSKCPQRHAIAIAYDPRAPARCRALSTLGKLGPHEAGALRGAACFLLLGLSFMTWTVSARQQGLRSETFEAVPRRSVQVLSNMLFWAAVLLRVTNC